MVIVSAGLVGSSPNRIGVNICYTPGPVKPAGTFTWDSKSEQIVSARIYFCGTPTEVGFGGLMDLLNPFFYQGHAFAFLNAINVRTFPVGELGFRCFSY